jgi:hypothetical protein
VVAETPVGCSVRYSSCKRFKWYGGPVIGEGQCDQRYARRTERLQASLRVFATGLPGLLKSSSPCFHSPLCIAGGVNAGPAREPSSTSIPVQCGNVRVANGRMWPEFEAVRSTTHMPAYA